MPIKYIGRTTTFSGKTLWEILGNLKDFGVGRIVVRHKDSKYPEPSYFRILKVGALPYIGDKPGEDRKVMALVEKTFRGKKFPKPVQIDSISYKADFRLIPKDKEAELFNVNTAVSEVVLPRTMEFPPLYRELLLQKQKDKGIVDDKVPEMKIVYNLKGNSVKKYRIAKEGECPDVKITIGLDEPASPSLYANIKETNTS